MNNLKALRKAEGLSLDVLGRAAGSSKAYMWDLEQVDGPIPGLFMAYKIANILNLTVYQIWPDTIEIIEETIIRRKVK